MDDFDPHDQLARRARRERAAMRELRWMTLVCTLLTAGAFYMTVTDTTVRNELGGSTDKESVIIHFYVTVVATVCAGWGLFKARRCARFLRYATQSDMHFLALSVMGGFDVLTLIMMLRL